MVVAVLHPYNIWGHIRTGTDLWHYPIGKSGSWQHISSVTLSDTELTSPCLILLVLNARLGSDKHQFYKSLVWLDWEPNFQSPTHETCTLPIRPQCAVIKYDCEQIASFETQGRPLNINILHKANNVQKTVAEVKVMFRLLFKMLLSVHLLQALLCSD